LRILIVDDLVDAADGLTRLLRRLGHDVRTVYDGRAALTLAEQFHPEVVVLDLALPRLDGYQVALGLRRMKGLQSACLIALSGYGQESDIRRGKEAGFDYHLVKPVAIEQILELLSLHFVQPA